MNITKSFVDKVAIPKQVKIGQTAQKRYYDDALKGFGLRVTSGGTKTFFVEKLVQGKLRRIKIGTYPALTAKQAENEAKKIIGQIASGIDPVSEKKAKKVQGVTLAQVFADYLTARSELKPKTIYDYKRAFTIGLKAFHSKPLVSITKDQVTKLHTSIGEDHGKAYANLVMRLLRAIFNFAAAKYEDSKGQSLVPENPTKRLSQARSWYRIERRRSFIKAHQLKDWFEAVYALENKVLSDYLLFILFTGLRRQEAAKLKWQDIDFKAKTLTILDTKNHEAHVLPLASFVFDVLEDRKKYSVNDYVFPGTGAEGYIIEPRKQMAKVIEATGIEFTVHDLRRTFITAAESLDIPAYALKRLLNHKMTNDVTSGYIITDVERLRKPMQAIADFLMECMQGKLI